MNSSALSKSLFILVFLFAGPHLNAQQYVSLGPVIGFGHSGLTTGSMFPGASAKSLFQPSFSGGLGLIYAKHEHWGFGGEVLFSKEGFKKQFTEGPLDWTSTSAASYIRVPLRVYYFFGGYEQSVRPKLYLGPSLGFNIGESYDEDPHNDYTSARFSGGNPAGAPPDYKLFDLGLHLGAGVNITLARSMWLNLDLNYYQGLLDGLDNEPADNGYNMNQHLRFQAGLLFGLGK